MTPAQEKKIYETRHCGGISSRGHGETCKTNIVKEIIRSKIIYILLRSPNFCDKIGAYDLPVTSSPVDKESREPSR